MCNTTLETLRTGPFWVLCALTGHPSPDTDERRVWAETLGGLSRGTAPSDVICEVDEQGAVRLVAGDDRSVASGLTDIAAALRAIDPASAAAYRRQLLTFGLAVATARGPFGRSVTPEDGQTLVLCAALIDHTERQVAVAA